MTSRTAVRPPATVPAGLFGSSPLFSASRGTHNLNTSDCHAGLASGSVLEVLVLWYQRLKDEDILPFARYIVTYY